MTQPPCGSMAQGAATTGRRHFARRLRAKAAPQHPGMVSVRRMSIWRSTLIALGGLVVVLGIALGVMTGVGAVLHAVIPRRHFDVYAVLHNQLVLLCLLCLSILWLLPPHPWAKELVEVPIRDDPEPRFPEPVTGEARVAVVSAYQCRAPPLTPLLRGTTDR